MRTRSGSRLLSVTFSCTQHSSPYSLSVAAMAPLDHHPRSRKARPRHGGADSPGTRSSCLPFRFNRRMICPGGSLLVPSPRLGPRLCGRRTRIQSCRRAPSWRQVSCSSRVSVSHRTTAAPVLVPQNHCLPRCAVSKKGGAVTIVPPISVEASNTACKLRMSRNVRLLMPFLSSCSCICTSLCTARTRSPLFVFQYPVCCRKDHWALMMLHGCSGAMFETRPSALRRVAPSVSVVHLTASEMIRTYPLATSARGTFSLKNQSDPIFAWMSTSLIVSGSRATSGCDVDSHGPMVVRRRATVPSPWNTLHSACIALSSSSKCWSSCNASLVAMNAEICGASHLPVCRPSISSLQCWISSSSTVSG